MDKQWEQIGIIEKDNTNVFIFTWNATPYTLDNNKCIVHEIRVGIPQALTVVPNVICIRDKTLAVPYFKLVIYRDTIICVKNLPFSFTGKLFLATYAMRERGLGWG